MKAKKKSPTKKVAKKSVTPLVPPMVGEYWKGQGGVYAGIRRHVENGVTTFYHLIDGPVSDKDMTFAESLKWIEKQCVDGCKDFVNANRGDGRLIAANLDPVKTDAAYFWLEQHAEHSSNAYCQDFDNGCQNNWHKYGKLRARAVRRLAI